MAHGISHICQPVAINLSEKYIIFEKITDVALEFNLKMHAAFF
jgi:histidinol phosphatase-like enzyme